MRALTGKRGVVLAIAAILLVSISVITAAFIFLSTARARTTAAAVSREKAFWLAEAGVQQAIYRLTNDTAYKSSPVTLNGSLGDGAYQVQVNSQAGSQVYNLTSTGTVAGTSRTVRQTVTFVSRWQTPFSQYGAFASAAGIFLLNNDNRIVGDVYTSGSVTTLGSSSVTGTVYAPIGNGNYSRLPLPDPPVPAPELERTYYSAQITKAATYARKDRTYSTLNLAGGTVYVNGKVTATNITGPGTLVCTGNCVIAGGTVSENVSIISNATLSMSVNSRAGSGVVFYASNAISLSANNIVVENGSLITPGTVALNGNNLTVNGALFAGGAVTMKKRSLVNGAVVSSSYISMSNSARIVQNPALLPSQVPTGIAASAVGSPVVLSDWQG